MRFAEIIAFPATVLSVHDQQVPAELCVCLSRAPCAGDPRQARVHEGRLRCIGKSTLRMAEDAYGTPFAREVGGEIMARLKSSHRLSRPAS
jgi:hypothetical protein